MKPTKPSYLNIPKSTNVSNPPTYTDSKYSTRNRPRPSFVYRSLSSVPKTKSISAPKHTSTLVPTKPRESISFRPRTSISGTPVSSSTKAASLNSKLSATQASNSSLSLVYPTTSTPNPISSVLPGSSTSGIPTLSSNIAHSPSTSNHDAATHSLINKLQCERNALIDKVMELTLQLERERRQPPASVTHTPPTAPAVSSRPVGTCSMKIAIFSDSMCRGVADIMRSLLPQVKITSDIKPGAVFAQVVASIPSQCQNFGPDDFIFIHAGTNDFDDSLQPNSTKRFSLTSPLVDLANKTNVVLCSVPFRFDSKAQLSTNISESNNFFKHKCTESDFKFFDTNQFLSRSLYTKEGIHYNQRGKRILASKLIKYIYNCNHKLSYLNSYLPTSSHCYNVTSLPTNRLPISRHASKFCDKAIQTSDIILSIVPNDKVQSKPCEPHVSSLTNCIPTVPTDDNDSTFGSFFDDTVSNASIINLSAVSVNLLSPPSHIPVVTSSHRPSNFSTGDRTLGT
ncbi:uncharacterized protein LOC108254145 [Diaphorina citri]|uniref:Uncharacterized protein LOC108254145 n=1 Tax=Diaphorina citri TaxID=121845 RepID=A0A3Q0JJR6_DIACI|nr:uncharacterized protein LOC108254145 [Diaphorina citri]